MTIKLTRTIGRPGFDSRRSQFFQKFNVAEIYQQQPCLERVVSAESLIVDQTHLVPVSGKLALKKQLDVPIAFFGYIFGPSVLILIFSKAVWYHSEML